MAYPVYWSNDGVSGISTHYDLRDSADDDCQRMLNAIEPGTFIPPHRHTNTSEDVVVLRGIAEEVFFSDDGQEISRIQLVPGSDLPAVHIPIGQYHQLRSLQSGTVVIEFKNTRYCADTEDYLSLK